MAGKMWTKEQESILVKYYPHQSTLSVAYLLRKSVLATYQHARKLGLQKTPQYMKSGLSGKFKGDLGIQHRFKKGYTPWNKGLCYQPVNGETRFSKGHKPTHTAYDGAISVRFDKGIGTKYIRISESLWMPLHAKNWQDANGPIPPGHIVVFKDAKRENREQVDNLELVSRKENMDRNRVTKYPIELQQAIRTLNKLKKQLK